MVEKGISDKKRKRVAWGITGCGDRLIETVEIMKEIKNQYEDEVEVEVYLSKAGLQVLKHYRLVDDLEESFAKVQVEVDANTPFLAGALQLGAFEFLVIAPATSNTVAKLSIGISDTLLCNSAIMALKASVPVYILPSDLEEGIIVTKKPDGHSLKLRVRKEDANNTKKLADMYGIFILKKTEDIKKIFAKYFKANIK